MYYLEPGLYTDEINPFEANNLNWPFLKDCGFTWASFQIYNPQLYQGVRDFDLPAVKAHGFTNVGVWGVIYDKTDFFNGGKRMGLAAVADGADHLIVDAEQVLKGTRSSKEAQKIIDGVRAGGWTKGVSISTLGSPSNPYVYDFEMDIQSFLNSGDDASLQPQDYYNEYEEYSIENALIYWKRLGVSTTRINHTIGLYPGKRGKISGAAWVGMLREAKVGKAFSVYMAQHGDKEDYTAFKDYIASIPAPVATSDAVAAATKTRNDMIFDAQRWLNTQLPNPQRLSRIRIAKRILQSGDRVWKDIAGMLAAALDDAGISQ